MPDLLLADQDRASILLAKGVVESKINMVLPNKALKSRIYLLVKISDQEALYFQ